MMAQDPFSPSPQAPGRPLVIAHRGLHLSVPENTPEAIRAAGEAGADWVELDVRETADGRAVLNHDEGAGGLVVAESTLAELETVGVATLRDGLQAASGLGVNLELKGPWPGPGGPGGLVEAVAADLEAWGGPLLISSFWLPFLEEAKQVGEKWAIGVLTAHSIDPDGMLAITLAAGNGYAAAVVEDPAVSEALAARARSSGIEVFVWTVNDPERFETLASWRVDGIITDDPAGVALSSR
jgi:glycerophosphoryl diester phosphodiesterase